MRNAVHKYEYCPEWNVGLPPPPAPTKGTVCGSTSIKILKFKIKLQWNFLKGKKIQIMLDFTEGTLRKTSSLITESQIQNQL